MSLPKPQASPRIEALDAVRGAALCGMFVFHLTWDLAYFRLIEPDAPFKPAFILFGHTVAGTFLALVGASLALALPDARPGSPYWRRLGAIVAAALAISALTYLLFPESFIFFGILHCIALGSLVTLPFLRLPPWITLLVGALCFVLPTYGSSAVFDAPGWWWLGLGTQEPRSNDWRPFFPWFGLILAGMAAMRLAQNVGLPLGLTGWRSTNVATRALVWGGRHSLLVYLVHQPIFLGVVFLIAQVFGPPTVPVPANVQDAPFLSSCTGECINTGADAGLCRSVCTCIAAEVRKKPPIWQRLVADALSPSDREAIDGYTQVCVRRNPP